MTPRIGAAAEPRRGMASGDQAHRTPRGRTSQQRHARNPTHCQSEPESVAMSLNVDAASVGATSASRSTLRRSQCRPTVGNRARAPETIKRFSRQCSPAVQQEGGATVCETACCRACDAGAGGRLAEAAAGRPHVGGKRSIPCGCAARRRVRLRPGALGAAGR